MKLSLPIYLLACLSLTAVPGSSDTIIVDCNGSGEFLSIQDGVDAAVSGDRVRVLPGVYTQTYSRVVFGATRTVSVCFEKNITLESSGGPEVTIIDGGGGTDFGVVALPGPEWPLSSGASRSVPTVKGFTVRNGVGYNAATGIVIIGGIARGNTVTDYEVGLASGAVWALSGVPEQPCGRSGESLIEDNVAEGNGLYGICLMGAPGAETAGTVSGNTMTGNWFGAYVVGPGSGTLVGNTIAQNTRGVVASNGPSWNHGRLDVSLSGNEIFNNTTNVWASVSVWPNHSASVHVVIGGAQEDANDIYGSSRNVRAGDPGDVCINAAYNWWGSELCDEFVPLFDAPGVPDSCFVYLPFLDESHTTVFAECESTAISPTSWGSIKAMYK
jgi:parallel beta-helix repeat protein